VDNKNVKQNKDRSKASFQEVLDGSILTKKDVVNGLPYIFFLTLLAIFYIGNRYNAEKIVRKSIEIQKELKELRSEAITSASKLMFISKQSEVVKLIKNNGLELKEAVEPPQKLIVHNNE